MQLGDLWESKDLHDQSEMKFSVIFGVKVNTQVIQGYNRVDSVQFLSTKQMLWAKKQRTFKWTFSKQADGCVMNVGPQNLCGINYLTAPLR